MVGTEDDKLLMFIKMVNAELDNLIDEFDIEAQEELKKALGDPAIRTLTASDLKTVCDVDVYDQ